MEDARVDSHDPENFPGTPENPESVDFDVEAPVALGQSASYLDLLKQDYEDLAAAEDVFIPVKGYETVGLQVKYLLPDSGKQLDIIARKVAKEYPKDVYYRNLFTAIDTMIVLCGGLYVQPATLKNGDVPEQPIELDPELTGMPAQFDQRLCEALGWSDAETLGARNTVRRLFGNNNDLAVLAHAEKLNRWLGDTKANLNVEFWQLQLGEAE